MALIRSQKEMNMSNKKFGVCVPDPVALQLDVIARAQGSTRSKVVNQAIAQFLKTESKSKPPAF